MNTNKVIMKKPGNLFHWWRIYKLYMAAFPDSERKPFRRILEMYRKGKADVWYFERNGRFAGLSTTINSPEQILIDYLAVAKKGRGQGIGSAALKLLREQYKGKGVFLEIESAFDDCDNKEERVRRRNFYLKNGLTSMGVMAYLFDVKMELLGFDCKMSFEEYHYFYTHYYGEWVAPHITPAEFPENVNI